MVDKLDDLCAVVLRLGLVHLVLFEHIVALDGLAVFEHHALISEYPVVGEFAEEVGAVELCLGEIAEILGAELHVYPVHLSLKLGVYGAVLFETVHELLSFGTDNRLIALALVL